MYTIHTMYEILENEDGKSSLRLKEIISNALKKHRIKKALVISKRDFPVLTLSPRRILPCEPNNTKAPP